MLRESLLELTHVVTRHLTTYQRLTMGVLTKEGEKELNELPAKAAKEIGDALSDCAVAWQAEKHIDFTRSLVLECTRAVAQSPVALQKPAELFAVAVCDRADAIMREISNRSPKRQDL